MKKIANFKLLLNVFLIATTILVTSCSKDDSTDAENASDPIVGTWKLKVIQTGGKVYNVTDVECYRDSYIKSDANTITFFIQDRLQDGSCETKFNKDKIKLIIKDGFYYLENENALDFDINQENNTLTWRLGNDIMIFQK